jgi:hypothetical protein
MIIDTTAIIKDLVFVVYKNNYQEDIFYLLFQGSKINNNRFFSLLI